MTAAALESLRVDARARGWTDRQWAAAADVRHETLSRVLHRGQCDTATLEALTRACDRTLRVERPETMSADVSGRWPRTFGREAEERVLELVVSGNQDVATWRDAGPAFFMAGLAFMLATQDDFDRAGLARLADELHPGIGSHHAFRRWLRETPLKPSRALPMIRHLRRRAKAAHA